MWRIVRRGEVSLSRGEADTEFIPWLNKTDWRSGSGEEFRTLTAKFVIRVSRES